jgi:hypothetical protein
MYMLYSATCLWYLLIIEYNIQVCTANWKKFLEGFFSVEQAKGWGSFYQTGDKGGWELVTMSKKLARQVSRVLCCFARGSIELLYIS